MSTPQQALPRRIDALREQQRQLKESVRRDQQLKRIAIANRRSDEAKARARKQRQDRNQMTPQRLRVLIALCEGLCHKLIAKRFDLALGTVKTHASWLRKHSGSKNMTQVGVWAVRHGHV